MARDPATAAAIHEAARRWLVTYDPERVRRTTPLAEAIKRQTRAELAAERERIHAAAGDPPNALEVPPPVAVGQRYEVRGEVWEVTAIGVDGTQAAAVVKLDAAGERTLTTDTVWYGELRTEARLVA